MSCTLSPLQSRIAVGEDPFILFVAEGANGDTDLFAAEPGGGKVTRVTFTPLIETQPSLTRQGGMVAFLRGRNLDANLTREVVVMNLINGAEERIELPDAAGQPQDVAWSTDEASVYLRTTTGVWRVAAPPAAPIALELTATELPGADSAFSILLGAPAFARAVPCDSGGICVIGPSGVPSTITATGTGALRWGADSVAWWDKDVLVVRSLGPGPQRRIEWTAGQVKNPRDASYAAP